MMFLDYQLPPELIAQRPVEPRDHARLLVVNRQNQSIEHRHVFDLPELLRPGDLVVVNDTKVLPARLLGRRSATGGKWEGLYLGTMPNGTWELLSQTRGSLQVGDVVEIEPSDLRLTLIDRPAGKPWIYQPSDSRPAHQVLAEVGHTPLPPYIRKGRGDEKDKTEYQTVYAERDGSVAAPTAGLHFTPELLQQLMKQGIERHSVTLHVGLGTFQPLADGDPTNQKLHREWCDISPKVVSAIKDTKRRGGRVVAIGTTSTRTLESAARSGELQPWQGETDLFIRPGFQFQVVDVLMTNFHLPKTSLLLLVSAFTGVDLIRRAYEIAVAERYRFFSYGDAMLVL